MTAHAERKVCASFTFVGKKIADFGCGYGDFLCATRDFTTDAVGFELQENCVRDLNEKGIRCFKSLNSIPNESIGTFFLFHSFEHLPEPLTSTHSRRYGANYRVQAK